MAITKIPGEYIEDMTEPLGWPSLNEDDLYLRSNRLVSVVTQLIGPIEGWQRQLGEIFAGGVWSGDAADAGNAAVQERISEMSSLHDHLEKSVAWYTLTADTVAQVKMAINENLTAAQQYFASIRSSPDLDASEKEAAIRAWVRSTYSLNAALVSSSASKIPPFNAWQMPPPPTRSPSPPARQSPPAAPPKQDMSRIAPQAPARGSTQPSTPMFDSMNTALEQATQHSPSPGPQHSLAGPAPSAPPGASISSTTGESGSGTALTSTGAPSTSNPLGSLGSSAPPKNGPANPATGASTAASSPSTNSGAQSAKSTANPKDTGKMTGATPSVQSTPRQIPPPLASPATASTPAPAPGPTSQSAAAVPSSGGSSPAASGGASGAAPSGAAPVGGSTTAAPPPVPLGPPTTPAPAAPPPAGTAPAAAGPGVAPMSAASASGAAAAPAPVPVSTARAERDAILAASTPGGRRNAGDGDPLQRARHIGAALNVGVMDFGFFWVTGLTADATIVVANSYGLAYIPDGVHLPEHVKMVTADESISPAERATWATYPILAVQGWCRHHDKQLRAVVATEEQFANFDPGVAKIILTTEDIPDDGTMNGRSRLEVIAPDAAQRLTSIADTGLTELLPPAATDLEPPADQSAKLWFDVAKPLMSTSPQRGAAHLHAFVAYANHAQELALHRAQTAAEPDVQRRAITDWIYWQHLGVLMNDAVASEAPA